MRVCYAELGMTLLLQLRNTFVTELKVLQAIGNSSDDIGKDRAIIITKQMKDMMRKILGFNQDGLAFMGNWLSIVVDTVPISM